VPSSPARALSASWEAIYSLNRDVIGPNPNLISPGEVLKLP
jgi:nucleoid-associated protein YgaU